MPQQRTATIDSLPAAFEVAKAMQETDAAPPHIAGDGTRVIIEVERGSGNIVDIYLLSPDGRRTEL
jgi:hypothetical protein